ncbi:MAG: hypothetical protein KatS3mg057_0624 [Herpetosiphonaceae bacterium]|nr:MAG: hypothetical protein KatS3mg057_0624 [Herpetosiphonaceae bacterium]
MVVALLLGLVGSLGHCIGMCSLMALVLERRAGIAGRGMLLAHLGRITSYAGLGLGAGTLGSALAGSGGHHATAPVWLTLAQGMIALLLALCAVYMALSLTGVTRSPELLLATTTQRWRRLLQRRLAPSSHPPSPQWLAAYGFGLLWGLLPCGLVMTALLLAAGAGSSLGGAATMLAFGLGTWPALLSVSWLARRQPTRVKLWPRYMAAALVLLFGAQMALRGLASWGWVEHARIGEVMVW